MSLSLGFQRFIRLRPESSWGVYASANPAVLLPTDRYTVGVVTSGELSDSFVGVRQTRHVRASRLRVRGSIAGPLVGIHQSGKSLAEHLLAWSVTDPTNLRRPSMSIDVAGDGIEDRRHLGVRVQRFNLEGETATNVVRYQVDVEGKQEVGGFSFGSFPSFPAEPVPFLMEDVAFEVAGEPIGLAHFMLTIDDNLRVYHTKGSWPTLIVAGARFVTLEFETRHESPALQELIRESSPPTREIGLTLKGRCVGTAGASSYTVCQISIPQARIINRDTPKTSRGGTKKLSSPVNESTKWIAVKPNSPQEEVRITWSLE